MIKDVNLIGNLYIEIETIIERFNSINPLTVSRSGKVESAHIREIQKTKTQLNNIYLKFENKDFTFFKGLEIIEFIRFLKSFINNKLQANDEYMIAQEAKSIITRIKEKPHIQIAGQCTLSKFQAEVVIDKLNYFLKYNQLNLEDNYER